MPVASPASSSTNSKPAPKGSAEAASQAADNAFGNVSTLSFDDTPSATPAEQQGRRRLRDLYWIERELIVPDPDQPRKDFSQQELSELAASIQSRGFKNPLAVRWDVDLGKYMIIDGERRFRAATQLKTDELPCWVQHGDGKDVLIDQIVHNWQRADLRPYETADALARLRDLHNLSVKELGVVTGKPKSAITKLLALHDRVVPEVQEMARGEGLHSTLTQRHLYSISQLPPETQEQIARKVATGNMTAIETEGLVSRRRKGTKKRGLAARQKRFHTSEADVVMTFRRSTISDEDICRVLSEIEASLRP